MARNITFPHNVEQAESIVIGIQAGWQYAADGSRHRTVYVYWHGAPAGALPEYSEWLHDPLEGNVLWTVGRVLDTLQAVAPHVLVRYSSSIDFPNEGTEEA